MKAALKNLALISVALLISILVGEFILRLVPNRYEMARAYYATENREIGQRRFGDGLFTLTPGAKGRKSAICYDTESIQANQQGFRDKPWNVDKKGFRIAVMGDSFVQAVQVDANKIFTTRLSKLTGMEVLNVGIGGYSTATQLSAYRRLVRPFRPNLVVLAFYLGNDVKGNSCALDPGRSICGRLEGGEVVLSNALKTKEDGSVPGVAMEHRPSPVDGTFVARIKTVLRTHSAAYHVLRDLRLIGAGLINQALGQVSFKWRLYLRNEQQQWSDAWSITEGLLASLKSDIEADGGRLAIVSVPEHFVASPDWRRELMFGAGSGVPDDFDVEHPSRRLTAIARKLDLPILDLLPGFLRYRDKFGLKYPYFSFSCDGHWNPLAHDLVAHEVAAFLAREHLPPPASAPRLETLRRRASSMSPREILGDKAYGEIYEGGVYRGTTHGAGAD